MPRKHFRSAGVTLSLAQAAWISSAVGADLKAHQRVAILQFPLLELNFLNFENLKKPEAAHLEAKDTMLDQLLHLNMFLGLDSSHSGSYCV